jgi:FtsP/CotA-like multicopper oxidase with cupredoxin domain
MFISDKSSKARLHEAERARENRREIVQALSTGQISRRDLLRWGLLTSTGLLVAKHGLSKWAPSAYAEVPTGTPPSPTFGAKKFSQPMPRVLNQPGVNLQTLALPGNPAAWPFAGELAAQNYSYHELFNMSGGTAYKNPVTGVGPVEGRPPGQFFAHQRWDELPPVHGYILSLGQVKANKRFHPKMPAQNANSVWSFGPRTPGMIGNVNGSRTGNLVPPLIKGRYGEPMICRIYNDLPVDRAANGGFGRNELSTHFHNAHNGAESDGACNAYHFPGTFYDYHWGMTLARRDMPQLWLTSDPNHLRKASGPDDGDGLVEVPGDFRELQGSMWFHDHRFFFTAENVHKGHFGLFNMYSGPDRGREGFNDGINLNLPSGKRLPWGNTDFDVNLAITNPAFDPSGQLFYDIFDTEGFLGDILAVNGAYYPYMQVLPRRYRFRILNASMSRFLKLAFVVSKSLRFPRGTQVPIYFIANDGNFVVSPIRLLELDQLGTAERYDVVVDFSAFRKGDRIFLTNLLQQTNGNKPDGAVSVGEALAGVKNDPAVGPLLEFRVVDALTSVDDPSYRYTATNRRDDSVNFDDPDWASGAKRLTEQIPIVTPVRVREILFGRSDSETIEGCIPDCREVPIGGFPWTIKVNGRDAHSLNANRISSIIPRPGDVEHWTLVNGGGGWDHPIHLHFEEGVTIDRGADTIPATEHLVRKDVWRLRPGGQVKFQVRFGEFGGAYVTHCHNTVHEDFGLLMRMQLLTAPPTSADYKGAPHWLVTKTPIPTPAGVQWMDPEILPEGDPNDPEFIKRTT